MAFREELEDANFVIRMGRNSGAGQKYDALIVGTAQFHGADVLVTLDEDVVSLAKLARVRVAEPKELLRWTQGELAYPGSK